MGRFLNFTLNSIAFLVRLFRRIATTLGATSCAWWKVFWHWIGIGGDIHFALFELPQLNAYFFDNFGWVISAATLYGLAYWAFHRNGRREILQALLFAATVSAIVGAFTLGRTLPYFTTLTSIVDPFVSVGVEPPNKVAIDLSMDPFTWYADDYDVQVACAVINDAIPDRDRPVIRSKNFPIYNDVSIDIPATESFVHDLCTINDDFACTAFLVPKKDGKPIKLGPHSRGLKNTGVKCNGTR